MVAEKDKQIKLIMEEGEVLSRKQAIIFLTSRDKLIDLSQT